MLFDRFFDCLGCIEEDVIWWLFKIKYLVSGISGDRHIWTQDKYTEYTGILSRPKVKKKVILRLARKRKKFLN